MTTPRPEVRPIASTLNVRRSRRRDHGAAARQAAEAGFDGIHIHGGNGYLISEFCSPHANTREDRWGGDAERRSRFFFKVAEAVRSAVGDDLPVTARLSVEDSVEGGLQRDESLALSLLDGVVEAVAWNGRSRRQRDCRAFSEDHPVRH